MSNGDDYRWLFRKAPIMATSIGSDGRCLDVNEAILARLGFKRGDMLGRRPGDFMTGESAARVDTELLPLLRRTGRLEGKPVAFVARDGEVVHCVTSALVERCGDGAIVRTVALYTELSDKARADWKYRQLYRAAPAMLHTLDAAGRIVTVTDHWLQKTGYRREEVVGRPITDFCSEADRRGVEPGRLQELPNGGESRGDSRQMVTRDGEVLDLLMSAVPERDAAGQLRRIQVASQDVTEQKRAVRELRLALAENGRLTERLEQQRDCLMDEIGAAMNHARIIGESAPLKKMLAKVEKLAPTPASVLVLGESGVGKELVAHALHARSNRSGQPLFSVNCAGIPGERLESEFFGCAKGAFAGASRDRAGRFQLADGGTIFLNEIGEIPLELQAKLLRVLQENEFERVGDGVAHSVDVRVIAATARNLEQLVVDGKFRKDLFHRLSLFPISVPPLRERRDDVLLLAEHFVEQACAGFGRPVPKLARAQAEALQSYDWPGNVRELKNVIERAVVLSDGKSLRVDLGRAGDAGTAAGRDAGENGGAADILTEAEMRELQKRNLENALSRTGGRVSGERGAAALLGIRPTTLADRIKSYGIRKPNR